MSKYPECDKLAAVKDQSQIIGQFLEWLQEEQEMVLCYYNAVDDLMPVRKTIEEWLAEYFEIDLNKAEEERRQMLAEIRGE